MTSETFQPPEGYTEDDLFSGRLGKTPRRLRRRFKFRYDHKKPAFMNLPRAKRRDLAASMGWRIASDPDGQGVYTTHDILPGSRLWPANEDGSLAPSYWADFMFMSRKPLREGVYYNAMAQSVPMVAANAIIKLAEEAIEARMTEQERQDARPKAFSKRMRDGGLSMVFAPDTGVASLGGLTVQGAQAQWLREQWNALGTLVEVRPCAELDRTYRSGMGLHMVVVQPTVDAHTLPQIIAQFQERGETAYTDEAVDLAPYLDHIRGILGAMLWRWEARQARAEGREPEAPDETLADYFDVESKPINL